MPLPTPREGESQDEFVSRCMGNPTMNDDFPDNEQRSAVCFRQWREAQGEQAADGTTAQCWIHHLGIWAMEPLRFQRLVALWKNGLLPVQATQVVEARTPGTRPYALHEHVAVIPVIGPLTKGDSKFGGSSTLRIRQALRLAVRDPEVHGILLQIDSPGGHVAGIQDLADDVYAVRGQKPMQAHIEDLGASAAYWIASQTDRILANRTAEVGSIGTLAVLEDSSKRMERLGITVHVLASGPYKGAGVEGAPISQETLAYLHQRVEAVNAHFLASLRRARPFTPEGLAHVSDGRVYDAETARQLGLLDAVQRLETTLDMFPSRSLPPAGSFPARGTGPDRQRLQALQQSLKEASYAANHI